MEANELKQMKELEEENARLKSIVANLALENDAVKNVLEKKLGRLTTNNK
ncbi:putative transposase [Chitinophaga sancti]|uniref:Putative transposase n=2 Tax=Chitinophaga sancti TaxID=1004 RepID=A0A1K1T3U6_9BACT|nr:putative transposase [Chitinophaga sancti]